MKNRYVLALTILALGTALVQAKRVEEEYVAKCGEGYSWKPQFDGNYIKLGSIKEVGKRCGYFTLKQKEGVTARIWVRASLIRPLWKGDQEVPEKITSWYKLTAKEPKAQWSKENPTWVPLDDEMYLRYDHAHPRRCSAHWRIACRATKGEGFTPQNVPCSSVVSVKSDKHGVACTIRKRKYYEPLNMRRQAKDVD